ncbi:hypothetical protein M8818_007360 [Zalaria obscura]|uniref:Uncharacterized protein n=1 Tax=Zalaria obscura TaxID=2024903 RepID=A0ACC3S3L4_9PEZI
MLRTGKLEHIPGTQVPILWIGEAVARSQHLTVSGESSCASNVPVSSALLQGRCCPSDIIYGIALRPAGADKQLLYYTGPHEQKEHYLLFLVDEQ